MNFPYNTEMRLGIASLLLVLSVSPVFASDKTELSSMQFNGNYVVQTGNLGETTTLQVGWAPIFPLGAVAIRGELGAMLLKNALGDRFLALNYDVFLRVPLHEYLLAEVGLGFQTWTAGNGGTKPEFSLNACVPFANNVFDRVFVGYSRFFLAGGVNEFKLGFGLVF